jgi:hypothetical protein
VNSAPGSLRYGKLLKRSSQVALQTSLETQAFQCLIRKGVIEDVFLFSNCIHSFVDPFTQFGVFAVAPRNIAVLVDLMVGKLAQTVFPGYGCRSSIKTKLSNA